MSTPQKKYYIEFKFNGTTVHKKTDDVAKAIADVRPPMLLTEMYITVKNGGSVSERKLTLVQGRKLFVDDTFREIFINNLLLY